MSHDELIQSIFRRALASPKLFNFHDALRSEYVPEHLPFRDDQITSTAQILSPILHSSRPSNLLIYGKTGTGKTAVAKHVLSKLSQTCISSRISGKFVYCNTRMAGTEYRVLGELAGAIGLSIPFTGLALTEVLSRIQAFMRTNSLPVIMILDEIDYLVRSFGDGLLYDLTNSSDNMTRAFLSLVGISNDLHFKEELGARVLSRLSEEELVFPPYTALELKTILQERAKFAFNPGTYADAAVNLCAALSGSEHGDARRAVDLLRIAGEVAEREGGKQLEERHVRIALQKIDQDRITDALKTLPLHAKLVLTAAVTATGGSSSGYIYEKYTQLCRLTSSDPLSTRRISGLITELDTLGLVTATVINYGRYGRTKKIVPQTSIDTLREAFKSDDMISQLVS